MSSNTNADEASAGVRRLLFFEALADAVMSNTNPAGQGWEPGLWCLLGEARAIDVREGSALFNN
jgi:hypothetical protein